MQIYTFAAEKSNLFLMSKEIRLKKGLTIHLLGDADKVYASTKPTEKYIVKPTDFHGLIPRLCVKVGDKVKAGTPLFYDKYNEKINFCSPVSGEITDIVRGEKRKIMEVVIKADTEIVYEQFTTSSADSLSREQIIETMLKAGIWPCVRQKPYDIIANPADMPKAIFISTFSTAPLAIDNDFALYGMDELFQKGLDYIVKLSSGKTHLNIDGNTNPSKVFTAAKGVQINKVSGPHPAGNVGVQIHHIDPINKGDVVWYLQPQDVNAIARLFTVGKYDVSKFVVLCGSLIQNPRYYRSIAGACISNLLNENTKDRKSRIISGDILSGTQINTDGCLGFYDSQLTVVPEGDEAEFLGWMLPGLHKFSTSKTFLSWLSPSKKYNLDTNMHGEERAYVMTGEYEKVLPMDIYPTHLIKAIMIEDVELMENLGIYEVSPEDLALCEFVCTSKIEVQSIIRQGLDLVRKENS
ncbi:MAG TPA: Na(+)-translocating NADH-quinone reductase subunit A [Flavobacteriales bacterium]|jgi:Na+-transporting NADH:ubiquinone oxidoreductase subunit A|nr:Na(+)-translocating NADH-quinone reductase subunit A [Flavobacteriales bacterium]|tara:strand:+ start:2365 stop:3762 length:1398 start_codon:yes stop_codon:yes gene_type:complete